MKNCHGIRQMLHQQAGTARMIEVHVCQEYEVDVRPVNPGLVQCPQQQRHAVIDASVDESRAALFND
jgi:hypothetical protein